MKDKNLENFLEELMQPRLELSGHSICPYLKMYSKSVKYSTVDNIDSIIENNPYVVDDMQSDKGSTFIYIIKEDVTYDQIVSLWRSEQSKYACNDIEILFMLKDDKSVPPLKILKNYSYKHNTLFILQRKSTLTEARNDLVKNTNYYNYWSRKNETVS
jgi:hypothetical protein